MFETILGTGSESAIRFIEVLLTIGSAFLCGGIISSTYHITSNKGKYSDNFGLTMILLPAVIAIIILLIGSDIARAFSLAGAFSIIRFRSAPGEPKDIAYVLFAMAAGLATGVGAYDYAILFTVILCVVMFVLNKTRYKKGDHAKRLLLITVPEDMEFEEALDEVMSQYTTHSELRRVKTTALGSLYQLSYHVDLLPEMSTKKFIDALRGCNGNLSISLTLVPESEAE